MVSHLRELRQSPGSNRRLLQQKGASMSGRLPMNIVRAIVEHPGRHVSYTKISRATGASGGGISISRVSRRSCRPHTGEVSASQKRRHSVPDQPSQNAEKDRAGLGPAAGQMRQQASDTVTHAGDVSAVNRRGSIFLPVLLPSLRRLVQSQRTRRQVQQPRACASRRDGNRFRR